MHSAPISIGAQGRGGVGGEVGVAGAGGEDDDAPLLEVPHGAAPDEGLGDLGHLDAAHDPGLAPELLEGVLQGEGVDGGGQHAHVVGAGAVHALGEPATPRKMLPPPMTTASSVPASWTSATSRAIRSMNSGEMPYWPAPIRASPEIFKRTRRSDMVSPQPCPAAAATSAAKSFDFFSRPSPSSKRTKRRILTFSLMAVAAVLTT
jgi:hypothetical protein